MRAILRMPGIELKTIREMNEILLNRSSTPISSSEQAAVWPAIEQKVSGMSDWVIVPGDLDLSRILQQTHALLPTLQRFA